MGEEFFIFFLFKGIIESSLPSKTWRQTSTIETCMIYNLGLLKNASEFCSAVVLELSCGFILHRIVSFEMRSEEAITTQQEVCMARVIVL